MNITGEELKAEFGIKNYAERRVVVTALDALLPERAKDARNTRQENAKTARSNSRTPRRQPSNAGTGSSQAVKREPPPACVFDTKFGSFDPKKVEEVLLPMQNAKKGMKNVWMRGTVVTPPTKEEVTMHRDKPKEKVVARACLYLEEKEGVVARVTLMGAAAVEAYEVCVLEAPVYVGNLQVNAVEEKYRGASGMAHEFVAFDGGQVHAVPSEQQKDMEPPKEMPPLSAEELEAAGLGEEVRIAGMLWNVGALVTEGPTMLRRVQVAIDCVEAAKDENMTGKRVWVTLWRKAAEDFKQCDEGKSVSFQYLRVGSFDAKVELSSTPKTSWVVAQLCPWYAVADEKEFPVVVSKLVPELRAQDAVSWDVVLEQPPPFTVTIAGVADTYEAQDYDGCPLGSGPCKAKLDVTMRGTLPFYCRKCALGVAKSVRVNSGTFVLRKGGGDTTEKSLEIKMFGVGATFVEAWAGEGKLGKAPCLVKVSVQERNESRSFSSSLVQLV